MIISHARKFVYYGPPKTASTSLHYWLSQPTLCTEKWNPKKQDQHNTDISVDACDYFAFASVRHPLDRCVSLWSHSQSDASVRSGVPIMSFEEFIRDYQEFAIKFYKDSQSEILRYVRVDGYVRFEQLKDDLFSMSPILSLRCRNIWLEDLPHMNKTNHLPWKELICSELELIIRDRWAEDWNICKEWE